MPAELIRTEAEKQEIMQGAAQAQVAGMEGKETPRPQEGQTTL
jgi:hypothetical protein